MSPFAPRCWHPAARAAGLLVGLLLPVTAWAWERLYFPMCPNVPVPWLSGNNRTYYIHDSVPTSPLNLREEIRKGAEAWDAGAGDMVRGANWHFDRGADTTSWSHYNGKLDVAMEDDEWFEDHYFGTPPLGVAWITLLPITCTRQETDIVFSDNPDGLGISAWNDSLPSEAGMSPGWDLSLAFVSAHEFGHAFGLEHVEGYPSTMNPGDAYAPPGGGDISGLLRLNEDEADALRDVKPGPATGKNFMLQKWSLGQNAPQDGVREAWGQGEDPPETTWPTCPGQIIHYQETGSPTPPMPIQAIVMSSSQQTYEVSIRWALKTPNALGCLSPGHRVLGTRQVTIGPGEPYPVSSPSWTVPNNTPVGTYKICAVINWDNAQTEITAVDNNVISRWDVVVNASCAGL